MSRDKRDPSRKMAVYFLLDELQAAVAVAKTEARANGNEPYEQQWKVAQDKLRRWGFVVELVPPERGGE